MVQLLLCCSCYCVAVVVLQLLLYCSCCCIAVVVVLQLLLYCSCCCVAVVIVLQLLLYCSCCCVAVVVVLQLLYCSCCCIVVVVVLQLLYCSCCCIVVVVVLHLLLMLIAVFSLPNYLFLRIMSTTPNFSDSAHSTSPSSSVSAECVVCSDSQRDTILLPCCHVLLCWSCAQRVKKCLLCKEPVDRKEKVIPLNTLVTGSRLVGVVLFCTSIIYPHVEISHHIIVDCTEWTSIISPHVEISPSL